jgi:uncharacterized RDD family membrane protein YckC
MGAGARGTARVAEATGIDEAVEAVAEEAVVRALESPAAERAIARALESEAVERSINRTIDSEMIDRVWERLLASDEVQKLVERIAQAPEVRQAIAYQGLGLVDDIGAQIGRIARRLDASLERIARMILRRRQREGEVTDAGIVTRGLALLVDGVILNALFFGTTAILDPALDAIFGGDRSTGIALATGTFFWILASSTYLTGFWSLSGETPGMRFLDLRLQGPGGPRLGFRRAFRRLVGVVLSVIPFGLGFIVSLFDDRRRTWADRMAQTEVLYLPPRREAPWTEGGQQQIPSPP